MSRIAELLLEQGRIAADQRRRSGALWGQGIAQLGQLPAQISADRQAETDRQAAQMLRARQEERAAAEEGRQVAAEGRAAQAFTGQQGALVTERASAALGLQGERRAALGARAADLARAGYPPAGIASWYDAAAQAGAIPAEDLPALKERLQTPEGLEAAVQMVTNFAPIEPAKGQAGRAAVQQRDPTKDVIDPYTGAVLSAGTPAAPKVETPTLGSFEDYVTRYAAGKGKLPRDLTPRDLEDARKRFQQSDDRPLSMIPVVIQTPTGPQLLNRGAGTAQEIRDAQGNVIGPAPTATQRERSDSQRTVSALLDSVGELTEKINTGQGALARISGEAEKLKAKANLSDDVAEYEALVASFTPIWARALGHTGVLTEQDVQSAKQALPKPGDSKSMRDRKLARINKIMSAMAPAPQAGSVPSPGSTPQGTKPNTPTRTRYDMNGNPIP